MKTYKVLVFKHLLKNNSIAKKGDEVRENQIINVEDSLKGGFIEEVKGAKKADSNDDKKSDAKDSKSKSVKVK